MKQEIENQGYEELLQNIACGICIYTVSEDKKIKIQYANQGYLRLCEGTMDEVVKAYNQDTLFGVSAEEKERVWTFFHQMAVEKKGGEITYHAKSLKGNNIWCTAKAAYVNETLGEDRLYVTFFDVTEQMDVQFRLKSTIENMPGVLVIFEVRDKLLHVRYISDDCVDISGFTAQETYERGKESPIADAHPEDRYLFQEKAWDDIKKRKRLNFTYRIICKSGAYRWVNLSLSPVMTGGELLYYGVLTDVNDERESAIMRENLVNALPGGIAIYKMGNPIETLFFSDGVPKLTGHTPEEYEAWIQGDIIENVVFADDRPQMRKLLTDAVRLGKAVRITYRIYHKNGSLVWIQLSGTKIREEDGVPVYYVIFTRPTEESSMYQTIVDDSETLIFVAEQGSHKIIFANRAWKKLQGLQPDSNVVGKIIYAVVPSRDIPYTDEEVKSLPTKEYKEDYRLTNKGRYLHMWGRAIDWNGHKAYISYLSDETELWDSHQQLQSQRGMLDAALKTAKVMVWKYDYRTGCITDSGSMGEAYGLPGAIENVPECFVEDGYVHEDSIEALRKLNDEIPQKELVSGDIHAKAPNGKGYLWQRIIYRSLYDEKGNYVESIGTAINITKQKEREQNYEEQLRLKQLLASNAIAVVHLNLTENTVSDVESKRKEILDMMQSGSVDDVMAAIRKRIQSEKEQQLFLPVWNHQIMMEQFEDGKTHFSIRHHIGESTNWYESTIDLISNPYNRNIEAIIALRDITKTVRTELIMKTLVSIDYDSIMSIDAETGEATPFVEENLSRQLEELKDNPAGVEQYIQKYCVDGDVQRVIKEISLPYVKERLQKLPMHDCLYSLKTGTGIVHKRAMFAYLEENQRTILCAIQDVTDTYEQEEKQKRKLSEALLEAEQANHAKTEFFSRMSHDMRTPMNGILGLAELSEQENDVESLKQDMQKIKTSGKYLLSLINDTLDFQRIESGKMKLEEQVVNCRELLVGILDLVKPMADAKQIELRVMNVNVQMEWFIRVDPVRMKQIFVNLLSNAIKFTPTGGTVLIEYECLERVGMISRDRFKICDTGIGMSREFIEKSIFQPFAQEYSEVSTQYVGSGLGLSIVHSLIELMGGSISVESEVGVGTSFTVYLDFERVDNQDVVQGMKTSEKKQDEARDSIFGKKILLVEDHALNAEIAGKILKKAGCEVVWADNGKKGVERFSESEENDFDAILMDIRMPVMTGLEAAKAIRSLERADAKSIPIIAMTANAYDEDIKQSLEAGMNDHLAKPIDPMKIYETLARYV